MSSHEFTPDQPSAATDAVAASPAETTEPRASLRSRRKLQTDLDWHRAETERLRVLVDFLARPICAHGGADPDPDIVTAYNLAVEAALQGIRHAAVAQPWGPGPATRPATITVRRAALDPVDEWD